MLSGTKLWLSCSNHCISKCHIVFLLEGFSSLVSKHLSSKIPSSFHTQMLKGVNDLASLPRETTRIVDYLDGPIERQKLFYKGWHLF